MKRNTQSTSGKPTVSETLEKFSFGTGRVYADNLEFASKGLRFDILEITFEPVSAAQHAAAAAEQQARNAQAQAGDAQQQAQDAQDQAGDAQQQAQDAQDQADDAQQQAQDAQDQAADHDNQ
jgi:hypothetical protein